jgi:arginyl-tRNA synthetase
LAAEEKRGSSKSISFTSTKKNMVSILEVLQHLFGQAIRSAYPNLIDPPVMVVPSTSKFGDYQCNSAMGLAKVCALN